MQDNYNDKMMMVEYARKYVPYYTKLYECLPENIVDVCFEKIPTVDKKMLLKGEVCLSVKFIGEYIRDELIHVYTSGSTGVSSEIYWNPKEMKKSLLSLWLLRKKHYGIEPRQKMCYFYLSNNTELVFENKNSLGIARSSLHDGREKEAYFNICSYNPAWMILQPSIALRLCDYADKYGTPSSIKYIEFTGEYLEESVRKRVESTFNCYTANQYGTKEVNSIAYECPYGRMHIMSDNVYIEVQGEDDEGDIYITTLQNHVMPMIRYKLNDTGKIIRNYRCQCGIISDILELNQRISDDMIMQNDGTNLNPRVLIDKFCAINCETQGEILQYQIRQIQISTYIVRLVICDKEWENYIKQRIIEGFHKLLGEVNVVFELYDQYIPENSRIKPTVFKNEMDNII